MTLAPPPARTIEHVRADELAACAELARLGLHILGGLRRVAGFVAVRTGGQEFAPALALLVRFSLELGLEPSVDVELDEQLDISAVMIDGQAASPQQWLQLERAGLPVLARPEIEEGGAHSLRSSPRGGA